MAAGKTATKKEKPAVKEPASADKAPSTPRKSAAPKAPRRPTLAPELARLLAVRHEGDGRRPRFTRQASYRYYRIGRDESWRRPRGQQSKQRRHYKYRSTIVSIGFRGPAATRGLTPTGFRPVVVSTPKEIAALTPTSDAAIIARTVGTKRRLVLEEAARKAGVHVLNPITRESEE
jgi:large subunit ribosomal protein L32e